ncbi:MAG TPA: hypothetical protein VFZ65_03295 [Planctomycetota bacterium]|nr:hypothetical protein [Planctomycetota bacterium]
MSTPRKKRSWLLVAWFACTALAPPACCGPAHDPVVIGAAQDRYDHNRQTRVLEWSYQVRSEDGSPQPRTLNAGRLARDEAYTPFALPSVPSARTGEAADALPAAHLVPVFTGVPLPLPPTGGDPTGTRADLVDFLGTGPAAKAGVERPELQGALPDETARRYGAMLELLGSATLLANRAAVLAWAEAHGVVHSFDVADSRYQASSFADRVALREGAFWFVLFQLPAANGPPLGYSRLVVVPAGPLRQSPDKGPGS